MTDELWVNEWMSEWQMDECVLFCDSEWLNIYFICFVNIWIIKCFKINIIFLYSFTLLINPQIWLWKDKKKCDSRVYLRTNTKL